MRTRSMRLLACLFTAVLLSLAGCSDDPRDVFGFSDIDWTIADSCDDGSGLQVRFFDRNSTRVWPNSSEVYVIGPGGSATFDIECDRDHLICFGAETDPPSGIFWGVGLDGAEGCSECCVVCEGIQTEFDELACN